MRCIPSNHRSTASSIFARCVEEMQSFLDEVPTHRLEVLCFTSCITLELKFVAWITKVDQKLADILHNEKSLETCQALSRVSQRGCRGPKVEICPWAGIVYGEELQIFVFEGIYASEKPFEQQRSCRL